MGWFYTDSAMGEGQSCSFFPPCARFYKYKPEEEFSNNILVSQRIVLSDQPTFSVPSANSSWLKSCQSNIRKGILGRGVGTAPPAQCAPCIKYIYLQIDKLTWRLWIPYGCWMLSEEWDARGKGILMSMFREIIIGYIRYRVSYDIDTGWFA